MLSRYEDGALYDLNATLERFRRVQTRREAYDLARSLENTARALRQSIEREINHQYPPLPEHPLLPSFGYHGYWPSYLKPDRAWIALAPIWLLGAIVVALGLFYAVSLVVSL